MQIPKFDAKPNPNPNPNPSPNPIRFGQMTLRTNDLLPVTSALAKKTVEVAGARFDTGRILFLSRNQQHRSTEGTAALQSLAYLTMTIRPFLH